MAYITIDHSDGRYSTRAVADDEKLKLEALGRDVFYVHDGVLDAYYRHCGDDAAWQAHWQALSNERYMRRREAELLPLEEAEREIARLNEELTRAKRMEKFYEDRYQSDRAKEHRARHVTYTCVYPQAGCDVDLLPEEWRADARDILENFRADLAAEGLRYQGCCCGLGTHRLLSPEESDRLRTAGYVVENDTEEDDES